MQQQVKKETGSANVIQTLNMLQGPVGAESGTPVVFCSTETETIT